QPETVFFALLLIGGIGTAAVTLEFEAPQALRAIAVLPAIAYFASLALWVGVRALYLIIAAPQPAEAAIDRRSSLRYQVAAGLSTGVCLLVLVLTTHANYKTYFIDQQNHFI